jgi:hypothetical protein
MSLQLLAKQMESKGRDGDSVLVHMTPGEVAGLQKLAESAGGSLSVNPETGLVEASFLKSILPTLVGAGVTFMTANPYAGAAAGAAVGGYQARRSGQDVGMGAITGGLGGYGGFQLASGAGLGKAAGQALTGKQMFQSGLMALAPSLNAPMPQQQGQYPLMSMDIDRRVAPFQDIQAYQGQAPKYTGGAGNVYIPQFRAAKGGTVNMASGGAFEDIRAYEGVMPRYSYVNGQGFVPMATQPVAPTRPQGLLAGLLPPETFQPRAPAPVIRPPVSQPMMGGDGGGYTPNPDFVTPEQQSAFYRDPENSRYAAITQAAQRNNPFASLQEYMDPGFTERQGVVAAGLNPNQNFGVPGFDYSADYDSFAAERAAVDRARPGLVDGGLRDPQQSGEMAAEAAASQQAGERDSSRDGMGGASEGSAGSTAATSESPDGPDGANAYAGGSISLASGGLMGLAKGGMRSGGFVVPADVVSMIGEGNTDAGYKRIKAMVPSATAIKGGDGGQADTVKTSIEGKQPARVAHGEMYIPPETVKSLGGAKKLYAMMDKVRQQATGSKKQIKPVNLKRAMA